MIHDWKMEVYWRLPVFVQEAALAFYAGYLDKAYYGDGYQEWRSGIRDGKVGLRLKFRHGRTSNYAR